MSKAISMLLLLAVALASADVASAKMMYLCADASGRATSIQDKPCPGAGTQRSYATPDHGGRAPAPGSGKHGPAARPREVDFTVACRSLNEERTTTIEDIRASGSAHETARLQKRLKRIHDAQCTARCAGC